MALKEEKKPASALATESPGSGRCQNIEPNSTKKSSVRSEQETCVFVLGVACFINVVEALRSVCGCSPGLLPSLPVQVPRIRTNIRMLDDEPGPRKLWIQKPINVSSEDHFVQR
ncbi:hypothetical protein B0T13DRAFT_486297 [Neurospora crassa]|nr:hypothetical protein B0T13DRAFT_486297 [Neurospora crassa]